MLAAVLVCSVLAGGAVGTAAGDASVDVGTAAGDASVDTEPVAAGDTAGEGVTVQSGPAGMAGNGTPGNPYVVTNATQLQALDRDLDAAYVLGTDVDASATAGWNGGAGFDPIGRNGSFEGTFDGDGHAVDGLTIDRTAGNASVFAVLGDGGVVRDVAVTNVSVTQGGTASTAAGLVGDSAGLVTDVTVSGVVTGGATAIGGLAGRNTGRVADSTAAVAVTNRGVGSRSYVGGLVGFNGGPVTRSAALGDVTGDSPPNSGDPGYGSYTGGLLGANLNDVSESYAAGTVVGDGYFTGGLIGQTFQGDVSATYATGRVTGNSLFTGGLVAYNYGPLSSSYAAGSVSGGQNTGGLVGYEERGPIGDSYWDTDATGQGGSAGGGAGLSTADMTGADAATSMDGFDFGGTWTTRTGDYPVLAWQVNGRNAPPTAGNGSYVLPEDRPFTVPAPGLLAGAADPDDYTLTASLATPPENGTATVFANGSFTYAPDGGFAGTDSFGYRVDDGAGGTATGTVTLTVVSNYDGPALPGGAGPPRDLDDDGRYEDVNANGGTDYDDVVTLFEAFGSRPVRGNVAAFDFNDNGRLDAVDLVTLFGLV